MEQNGKRTVQVNVRMSTEDYTLIQRAANVLWPDAVLTNSGILLGLAKITVQRMARHGEIPHYRVGKYYRYRKSELNDFLVLHSVGQINPPASTRKEIQ